MQGFFDLSAVAAADPARDSTLIHHSATRQNPFSYKASHQKEFPLDIFYHPS